VLVIDDAEGHLDSNRQQLSGSVSIAQTRSIDALTTVVGQAITVMGQ
jgi:hypothetical protein